MCSCEQTHATDLKTQDSDRIKLAVKGPFIVFAMDYPGLTFWKNDWMLTP